MAVPKRKTVPLQHPLAPLDVEGHRADPVAVPEPRLRRAQAPAHGVPDLRPVRRPPGPLGLTDDPVATRVAAGAEPLARVVRRTPTGPPRWLRDALGVELPGRAARPRADPPVVRVRERRAADQRAPGVPRRLGPRPGRHRRALPQPAGPARGPAGQAACLGGQHDLAGRCRPAARRRRHRPAPAARPRRGDHRRPREGLDPRRRARGADRRGAPRAAAWTPPPRSCTGCSTRCWSRPPPAVPAWTGRPASRSSAPPAGWVRPATPIEDEGPDHAKTFTAAVVLAGTVHGRGSGRTKKAAEQEAAEVAWRALSTPRPRPDAVPELPEVEVVRRGLEQWVAGRTVAARRGAPPAGRPPAPRGRRALRRRR